MGPQPFGCGRPSRLTSVHFRRSFNGAATFRLRKGYWPECQAYFRRCFNGAATFRLRKVYTPTDSRWQFTVASMGPQPFGCGRRLGQAGVLNPPWRFNGAATFRLRKEVRGFDREPSRLASMGPQPFGCGRQSPRRHECLGTQGFNGAATFRLRKVANAAE